jgi:hypothetical protein
MIPNLSDHLSGLHALDHAGIRRALQRAGVVDGQPAPMPADAPEVAALLSDAGFLAQLDDLAGSLGRDPGTFCKAPSRKCGGF